MSDRTWPHGGSQSQLRGQCLDAYPLPLSVCQRGELKMELSETGSYEEQESKEGCCMYEDGGGRGLRLWRWSLWLQVLVVILRLKARWKK